jgi:hypothetical protein
VQGESAKGSGTRDIGEFLAPYRTALWYDHRGNHPADTGRIWTLLEELSTAVVWDSISPEQVPILSIHFGSIVNHQFTLHEVNEEMVWCAMVFDVNRNGTDLGFKIGETLEVFGGGIPPPNTWA